MNVYVMDSYDDMSEKAFTIVKEFITNKPNAVLGLSTGGTPIGLYEKMIEDYKNQGTSYANCISYNLDEYVEIDPKHPESYVSFMHRTLFDHIDLKPENIHMPSGSTQGDCDAYEQALKSTTLDLQILGIGSNGHIGFNEPGTPFDMETHIVALTESTRKDNARFFDNDMKQVPHHAMSMGIASIMRSKKIILLASGENKADAIAQLVNGIKSEACPATALQAHDDVTVIVDKSAGSKL
ncbi:glucosamine-6-phosphate deaminase [Amedibacillus sp. YH-ame10]